MQTIPIFVDLKEESVLALKKRFFFIYNAAEGVTIATLIYNYVFLLCNRWWFFSIFEICC